MALLSQNTADNLLQDLTEPQRQAVTHVDGPLLIVAGAGSGKTRVITRRVAYLISLGIEPSSILAITFTNKAAGEMKERISAAMDRPIRDFGRLDQRWPTICTFHSLCLRILRHYAPQIGLPPNFSIYDSSDQTRCVKEALKQLEMSATNFPPGAIHGTISNAKNQLLTPEAYAQQAGDFYSRNVARVYRKYQELLAQNNALDFDDLLLRTTLALRDHPNVLAELQERFRYILIDEYQDTNHAQYILAHALAQKYHNICVVGDPDQSIYAWRGADIANILEFERDYPKAKIVKLEQNYRSTKVILHIASALISKNLQRKEKGLWTENAGGEKAELYLCQDEHDEANIVASRLKQLHDEHNLQWNQMAIFYRMNSLSRVMEDALRKENLPYVMARGVEFYNRKEIKDVLAYLRVVANPADEVSLTRIINTPTRGLGDQAIKQLQAFSVASGISFWNALQRAGEVAGLSSRAVNSARAFVQLVQSWQNLAMGSAASDDLLAGEKGPVQLVMEDVVRRSGLEAYYRKEGGDEQAELANIDQLITSAAEFDRENESGTLDEYLSMISLVSDVDHLKGRGGAITMMTLHAAKGLEFPVVAMIGFEDGCLPHARARDDLSQLEEERRLAFVGITRAQQRLILTRAAYRTIRGLRERTITSPFLKELPPEDLVVTDRTELSFGRRDDDQAPFGGFERPSAGSKFRKGQLVRHPQFGIGRIVDLSPAGSDTRLVIQFNAAGQKTLIHPPARLEAVG